MAPNPTGPTRVQPPHRHHTRHRIRNRHHTQISLRFRSIIHRRITNNRRPTNRARRQRRFHLQPNSPTFRTLNTNLPRQRLTSLTTSQYRYNYRRTHTKSKSEPQNSNNHTKSHHPNHNTRNMMHNSTRPNSTNLLRKDT